MWGNTLQPVWLHLTPQPVRRDNSQDVERVAERFQHTCSSIQQAHFCEHLCRVRSLASSCFEPPSFFA